MHARRAQVGDGRVQLRSVAAREQRQRAEGAPLQFIELAVQETAHVQ